MGNSTIKKSGGSQAASFTPHPDGHQDRLVIADAFTRAESVYSTSKDSKVAVPTTQRNNLTAGARQVSGGGGEISLETLPVLPSVVPNDAPPQANTGLSLALQVPSKSTNSPSPVDGCKPDSLLLQTRVSIEPKHPDGQFSAPPPEYATEKGKASYAFAEKDPSSAYDLVGWMFAETRAFDTNDGTATNPSRGSAIPIPPCPEPAANLASSSPEEGMDDAKTTMSELTPLGTAMPTGVSIGDDPVPSANVFIAIEPGRVSAVSVFACPESAANLASDALNQELGDPKATISELTPNGTDMPKGIALNYTLDPQSNVVADPGPPPGMAGPVALGPVRGQPRL